VSSPSGSVPVLFLVFNRPEPTARVLGAIRRASPRRLFVAADGPRPGNPKDAVACREVRELLQKGIDWQCRVEFLARGANLGCRNAVSSAISWFFDNVEEGIILEDDCLPSEGFFSFCSSLLARYRDEPRVAHIGGFNCQWGRMRGSGSYYFSRYFHVWGWATWRRAWSGYDVDMRDYPSFLAGGGLENLFSRPALREFWKENFDAAHAGTLNTWDYQWVYRNFKDDRLAAVPNWNLVENIGFGSDATHTGGRAGRMPHASGDFPTEIVHPSFLLPDQAADDFTYRSQLKLGMVHDAKRLVKRLVRSRGSDS
jgi:hypothetical protein